MDVTHAFTLKSPWLTAAILHRRKALENRSQEWKPGWYAVHTGVAKDADGWAEKHVREACDDDADVALIAADIEADRVRKGFISGLCHVSHCLPPGSCNGSRWALGPVCMVIDQTLWLETPLAHSGQLGTWPISMPVRCAIQQQVDRCAIGFNAIVPVRFAPNGPALIRMREKRRTEKRKSREEGRPDTAGKQPKLSFGSR